MTRHRLGRRLALAPALAWLLMQFVMTGVLVAPAASAGLSGPGLGPVVICTPSGLKILPAEGDAESLEASGCEWCQAFGAVAKPAPSDAGALERDPNDTDYGAVPTAAPDRVLAGADFLSRAPPL